MSDTQVVDATKPITQVLVDVSRDVGAVKKLDTNSHQGYKFRGIDAVVNAVHPALVKHGVFMQPEVLEIHYSTATANGKQVTIVRIKYKLTFHGPAGDSIAVVVWGEANDWGDKGTPKAHSVALRTALLQALCLPTDEPDPDHDSYVHEPPQEPAPVQGPTEEQVAAYRDLSAKASHAQTIDELSEVVGQAAKVPCLEPMGELLATKITRMLEQQTKVDDVKKLWRVASNAGVLHVTKDAIQQRADHLKAQKTVEDQLGAKPVDDEQQ